MALKCSDFHLTHNQLKNLNLYIEQSVNRYAQAEGEQSWGVKIVFEWVPGFGRHVTAYFDGAVAEIELEDVT